MITLNYSVADLLQKALDRIQDHKSAEAIPYIEIAIESLEQEKPAVIKSSIPQERSKSLTKSNADSIQGVIPLSVTSRKVYDHVCDYINQIPVGGEFKFIDVKNYLKYVLGFSFNQRISDTASDHLKRLTSQKYLERPNFKGRTYIVINHPYVVIDRP
jgi:hypothetical protein